MARTPDDVYKIDETLLLFLIVVGLCTVVAEPPVNTYLPATQSGGRGPFGAQPSTSYGTPSSSYGTPDDSYGAPNDFGKRTSSSSGEQSYQQDITPPGTSSQYDAQNGQLPSSGYSVPMSRLNEIKAPSPQYGIPAGGSNGSPSSQYGAPVDSYSAVGSAAGGYGLSAYAQGGAESYDDQSEPAKYDFNYEVNAPEYAVEFGHEESRDGDKTRGSYHVLLPDGRRQLVQYTADSEGYKPIISYEGTANGGAGGYNGAGGYSGTSGPSGTYGAPSAGGNSGGYSGSAAGYSAPSADEYNAPSTNADSFSGKQQDNGSGPY